MIYLYDMYIYSYTYWKGTLTGLLSHSLVVIDSLSLLLTIVLLTIVLTSKPPFHIIPYSLEHPWASYLSKAPKSTTIATPTF